MLQSVGYRLNVIVQGLTPVVQKVDNVVHRINLYPLDSEIIFPCTVLPCFTRSNKQSRKLLTGDLVGLHFDRQLQWRGASQARSK